MGLVIGFSMVLRDTYPSLSTEPSLLGSSGQPLINRIADYLSFFTIWSNIVVAIVAGHFVFRPRAASSWFRTLWLSALLMISVTGLIYHFALAALVDPSHADSRRHHRRLPLPFRERCQTRLRARLDEPRRHIARLLRACTPAVGCRQGDGAPHDQARQNKGLMRRSTQLRITPCLPTRPCPTASSRTSPVSSM